MALAAEEFEGQSVKSLKTSVAKQIGVPRFRQRWLSEDHIELKEEAVMVASDVQLVVLDFVQAEDGDIQKLVDACRRNDVDRVDELLRKPLDPNIMVQDGNILHLLAGCGHVECDVAIIEGHYAVVQLLLEAGIDKDAVDSDGQTALHLAVGGSAWNIVPLLLEAGADIDATDSEGCTALHVAIEFGCLETVRRLLEAGADKDATDSEGNTALSLAVLTGRAEVRTLLEAEFESQ